MLSSRGIFPTQRSNPVLPHCRRILHSISPFPKELGLETDGVLSRTGFVKRELLLLLETGSYSLSQPSSPKVRTFQQPPLVLSLPLDQAGGRIFYYKAAKGRPFHADEFLTTANGENKNILFGQGKTFYQSIKKKTKLYSFHHISEMCARPVCKVANEPGAAVWTDQEFGPCSQIAWVHILPLYSHTVGSCYTSLCL